MLPDPLHPAVIHFPIVLAVVLPIVALVGTIVVRRGVAPLKGWGVAVLLAAALAGSAWVATETGEEQEERVERVVGERALDSHQDSAKLFTIAAAVVVVISLAGLRRGALGAFARGVTLAGSLVLVGMAFNVGRLGGELVYRHGAASAYTRGPTTNAAGGEVGAPVGDRDRD